MPLVRKNSQSASVWFQCASVESRSPPAASPASSWLIGRCSISSIAHLILGRLAETRHRPHHPVGGPFDQALRVDDRQSEQLDGLRGVGEPGGRPLLANKDRLLAEQFPEFPG